MIEEFVIHKHIWGMPRFNSQTLSVLSMDIIKQRMLYKYKLTLHSKVYLEVLLPVDSTVIEVTLRWP